AGGVEQAGVLLFLGVRDEFVVPGWNPGREGQVDHTVVVGDVLASQRWRGGCKARRGDVLRLVSLCAVGIEQDQGVVADVRGSRRLEGREDDLRGGRQVTVRLVDRILHVEREGLEQREIGRRGRS